MAKRPAKRVAKRKARDSSPAGKDAGATIVFLNPGAEITLADGSTIFAPPKRTH